MPDKTTSLSRLRSFFRKGLTCTAAAYPVSQNLGADRPERPLFTPHLWFVVLCVASGLIYWEPLSALVRLAYQSDYYSHTVVIPLLAGYLVYTRRKEIFTKCRTSVPLGLPLLLAGAFLSVVERFALAPAAIYGHLALSIFSLVLLWMGWFALCYGKQAFLAAQFALLLLLLMVPLPLGAMYDFIHLTRLGSTEVAAVIFTIFGVPVFQHGFFFLLPGVSIEVAKECSGIHSTMALFILTLMIGYLFLGPAWKRVLLLLFVFPIVSLTNGLRIAALTLLAAYVDRNIFSSPLHRDGGVLFFLFALGLLMLVVRLFRRWHPLATTGGGPVGPFAVDLRNHTTAQPGRSTNHSG